MNCRTPKEYRDMSITVPKLCSGDITTIPTTTTRTSTTYLHYMPTEMLDFTCDYHDDTQNVISITETKSQDIISMPDSPPGFNIKTQDDYVVVDFGENCINCKIIYIKNHGTEVYRPEINCLPNTGGNSRTIKMVLDVY